MGGGEIGMGFDDEAILIDRLLDFSYADERGAEIVA